MSRLDDVKIPHIRLWRHRQLVSQRQAWLFIIATFIGAVTGAMAALLKLMIGSVSGFFTIHFNNDGINWYLLGLPISGIVLCGIFQRYILHTDLIHGVRQITNYIKSGEYNISPKYSYGPMIASTLTLGFGGSAGSEGPIATAGASIGSNLGRILGVSGNTLMILIGCGAGAGIAGIFKAPIGGFLFVLEVLKLELTTMSVMAILLACVTSSLVAYTLSGFTVDLSYIQEYPLDYNLLIFITLLGFICGLYSVYYSMIMKNMERFYNHISNPWVKNITSGLVAGVCIMMFPALYGEGYGVMARILNGDSMTLISGCIIDSTYHGIPTLIIISAVISIIKAVVCSSSNCGGGVAGDFAPTLFAGCFLGFCFASVVNTSLSYTLPVSAFAFCSMAGVMSGVIRAPFMAIFLTAEMTNSYNLILPLVITATISYGITRLFNPVAYYNAK